MSGQIQQQRQPRATAIRMLGLNPGEVPYVEIDYEDDRDSVQRIIDGSADYQRLIAEALGVDLQHGDGR